MRAMQGRLEREELISSMKITQPGCCIRFHHDAGE